MNKLAPILALVFMGSIAAHAAPPITVADLRRASELQISGVHAGKAQGDVPATKHYVAPSPIFNLMAGARFEAEAPAGALGVVGPATLMIGGSPYRILVPLFPTANARLFFSVAPDDDPGHMTFFSLPFEQGTQFSKYFQPPR